MLCPNFSVFKLVFILYIFCHVNVPLSTDLPWEKTIVYSEIFIVYLDFLVLKWPSFYEVVKCLIIALGGFGWLLRLLCMPWLGEIKNWPPYQFLKFGRGRFTDPKIWAHCPSPASYPLSFFRLSCTGCTLSDGDGRNPLRRTSGPSKGLLHLLAMKHSHFQRPPYYFHTPLTLKKFLPLNWNPLSIIYPLL